MPVRKFQSLAHLLGDTGPVSQLARRAAAHEQLVCAVRAILPDELARHCLGAALEADTLYVLVPSGAWSTQLRFQEQLILEHLARRHGIHARRLKCRVTAAGEVRTRDTRVAQRDIPPASRELIERTADDISDPDLAAALRRLSRHQTR